ncbi:hypothetical protein BAUCODRAFT_123922 [Baudoinia panamericana UAMH 10762]|uniref:Protein ZIP4 homolog n=1 Tax=Baudoinia panamericana (strain UAMH 10762) TaxID=717646 RepID=M2N9L9_BAUPA|nr:uncharacterized protein BAUCODRAFT_123922 [Baudoinia panamericana UAMH 10762]EMC95490.1 hypothetical protein BAUCODRAFT_123922 [Baudoinia panamericana UAMH 10762]
MALWKPPKKGGNDGHLQHVVDLAARICTLLKDRLQPLPDIEQEVETTIKRSFPLPRSTISPGKANELDRLGSQLWNATTNLCRANEDERDASIALPTRRRVIVVFRVFGYLLIDAAHNVVPPRGKDFEQHVRTFKVALKACRSCLETSELGLAQGVLEKCSAYATAAVEDVPTIGVTNDKEADTEYHNTLNVLVVEYYLLRMTHAWKSDRFDLADHFFVKVSQATLATCASLTEKAADLFHRASRSLVKQKRWDAAIQWCERAIQSLNSCEMEELSFNVPELRLAITVTYVEALLASHVSDAQSRAAGLVEQLENAYGMSNRLTVALLRFRILTAIRPVDSDELQSTLSHIIRVVLLTEKTFRMVMQTLHEARHDSTQCALAALQQLIVSRLLVNIAPDGNDDEMACEWLERATVTYVLFATTLPEQASNPLTNSMLPLFDTIFNRTKRSFSPEATHTAQTLLWKKANIVSGDDIGVICRLLSHSLFDSAGQVNKARIGRKAISAALARNDANAAREAFFQLPAALQCESLTRFLLFKAALLDGDHELAYECLDIITKHADRDPSCLYACVLAAQQSNMRRLAVAAMQRLIGKQPTGVHLPSLLRCTARLLIGEIEAQQQLSDGTMEEIVTLFERASQSRDVFHNVIDEQWRSEIQWWSKNAFNFALRFCADMHPEHLVRLLAVCTALMAEHPTDDGIMHRDHFVNRKLLCNFLASSALIVLARANDDGSEYGMQCYLRARGEITDFRSSAETALKQRSSKHGDNDVTTRRLFELLKFDLECILKLQLWDELDEAVRYFLSFEGTNRWDTLTDLVLISHDRATAAGVNAAATARIPQLLQKCINETWKQDKDITKMARWLRLTFGTHAKDEECDFALKIVQQAAAVAKKGDDGETERYPDDELQWLATTAFNKAVDWLHARHVEAAEPWITAALELARYADDNGALHATLTHKRELAKKRARNAAASPV